MNKRRGRMMFVDPDFWHTAKINAAKEQKSMVDYTKQLAKELNKDTENEKKKKKFNFGL